MIRAFAVAGLLLMGRGVDAGLPDLELVIAPAGPLHVGKAAKIGVGIRNDGKVPVTLIAGPVNSGMLTFEADPKGNGGYSGQVWVVIDADADCLTEPSSRHRILPGRTYFYSTQITPSASGRAELELGVTLRRLDASGHCGPVESLEGKARLVIAPK